MGGHLGICHGTDKRVTEKQAKALGEIDTWCNDIYLVSDAWSWGSDYDLKDGAEVEEAIIKYIDKFIDEKGEENL